MLSSSRDEIFLTPQPQIFFTFSLVAFSYKQHWLKWHYLGQFIRCHTGFNITVFTFSDISSKHEMKLSILRTPGAVLQALGGPDHPSEGAVPPYFPISKGLLSFYITLDGAHQSLVKGANPVLVAHSQRGCTCHLMISPLLHKLPHAHTGSRALWNRGQINVAPVWLPCCRWQPGCHAKLLRQWATELQRAAHTHTGSV